MVLPVLLGDLVDLAGGGGGTNRFAGTASQYPDQPDTPAPFRDQPTQSGPDGMSQGNSGGNALTELMVEEGGGGAGNSASDVANAVSAGGEGKSAFNDDTNLPSTYGTPGPVSNARYFAAGGGGGSRPAGAPGNQSVVVVLVEVLLMEHLVQLTPVVVAVVVRMASVLDMVVAVLEDSFKDSPELFQLEHTQLQLVLEQQQNPNAGAGADGIVIIRYQ